MPDDQMAVIDQRFSSDQLQPRPWSDVDSLLETAELFFITTVRPDGRPNTCPLLAVWHDGGLHFSTGETEQKARNIARNPQVTLAIGNGIERAGFDLVIEGDAVVTRDEEQLRLLARRWAEKYPGWDFDVRDGAFWHDGGGRADVYRVEPAKVLGFAKGEVPGQMRWRPGDGA